MQNNLRRKNIFIKNLFKLPGIYFFLLKSVRKQEHFIKKELEPELLTFRKENDGSLKEAHFKKITSYYAMGVPAILGDSLCILRGFGMTRNERLCMSFLGGISGLLDDLFDEPGKSADHLESFILNPEALIPSSTHEKLLRQLYLLGLSYSPHPNRIKEVAMEVFRAQQRSLDQKECAIKKDIEELTFLKGGNSFKYYRLCLSHALDEKEEQMLYQLGGLMQLGNDIFDVWEDARDGIATLATKISSIHILREKFRQELKETNELVRSTNYQPKAKMRFQRTINLAIARVFVCLDQFENLESSSGEKFEANNYSRKQLICDMQKPTNQIRAIRQYFRIPTSNSL